MKRIACLAVSIIVVTAALAAEKGPELDAVDREITQKLAHDKWDDASKAFVRALWEDFQEAHLGKPEGTSTRGIFGKMPDVEKYDDYLGAFGRGANATRPFVEITRDEDGRFFVKLERQTLPAVRRNKIIVFTTGDVIYSSMPTFGDKPYCTLEMFMIIRTDGKFFFAGPSTTPDQWAPLSKLSKG